MSIQLGPVPLHFLEVGDPVDSLTLAHVIEDIQRFGRTVKVE